MKQLFLIACLLVTSVGHVQLVTLSFRTNDEWFEKYGSKGLKVGDKIPDISLGTVINNYTGKKRFSEFKGKLVILDFWDTYCTSCIAGFPKMEALQKEFGNKIQVILVNVRENAADIQKRTRYMKGFKMPNLPCIVSSRPFVSPEDTRLHPQPLDRYFPTRGVPHHVWIDRNGIVVLRGGSENTYAQKIEEYLSGKNISYLNNDSSVPAIVYDQAMTYNKQIGRLKATPISYGSFITPYNNEITGAYGDAGEITDSFFRTKTNYYINFDLTDLYVNCFRKTSGFGMDSLRGQVVYSPEPMMGMDFIVFPEDIDTLQFIAQVNLARRALTTEEFIRSKYCYGQVLPWEVSEKNQGQFMLEDLNRYFSMHYGVIATLESRKTFCYTLRRISNEDKITADSSGTLWGVTTVNKNGSVRKEYHWALEAVISDIIRSNKTLDNFMLRNKKEGRAFILLNETGWSKDKKIAIDIPVEGVTTIDNLREALKSYDLDIIEVERQISFIVFKKNVNKYGS